MWSELTKPTLLIPFLEKLGTFGFGLNLAITPKRTKNLKKFIDICEKNDVELNFWPLLSKHQGYWINRWNINVHKNWIKYLLENYPTPSGYLLDLENPINFTGINGIVAYRKLAKNFPNKDVRMKLEAIVDDIHDFGKKAISTAYGGLPLGLNPRPSNADFYSYMVYTSYIKRISCTKTRQDIVYYCAKKINLEHGNEKAAIDLGITTHGVYLRWLSDFFGYLDLSELLDQIAVCLYVNLKRIHIFSFDNMILDLDKWLEGISNVKPKPPPLFSFNRQGFMYLAYKKFLFKRNLTDFC